MEYKLLNDNELIYLINDNNDDDTDVIIYHREYSIYDKDVDAVWEAVVPWINKLTWLIQEYIPDYISECFRRLREEWLRKYILQT